MLVHGTKQWWLVPPERSGFSKVHPDLDRVHLKRDGVLPCVQFEGEVIFVPEGWGHAVLNHGDVVALGLEFELGNQVVSLSVSVESFAANRPPFGPKSRFTFLHTGMLFLSLSPGFANAHRWAGRSLLRARVSWRRQPGGGDGEHSEARR